MSNNNTTIGSFIAPTSSIKKINSSHPQVIPFLKALKALQLWRVESNKYYWLDNHTIQKLKRCKYYQYAASRYWVLTNQLFQVFDSVRIGLLHIHKLFGKPFNIPIRLALKHHCYFSILFLTYSFNMPPDWVGFIIISGHMQLPDSQSKKIRPTNFSNLVFPSGNG